jgi:hypothetical protein
MFPHGLTAGLRGMCRNRKSGQATRFGLIPICVATIFLSTAIGQSTPQSQSSLKAASAEATASSAKTSPYHPQRFPKRATDYYGLVWGVDSLSVKWAESGEIIRFSYRVLDADKAKVLNDKKNEPSLVCPRAGVKLVVPSLEKVGQLRQSAPPEAGKAYWMAFSNKGRPVKRGDRVSIVIGKFRADGLVVD